MADNNFGVSCKGKPIASIPAEKKTKLMEISGKVVVYSERHISELPGQQPLPDCMNIIFTDGVKTRVKTGKNVILCDTVDDVRKELEKYNTDDINIIENSKLYREFMKDTKVIHMTKIDYEYSVDEYIEDPLKDNQFVLTADSDELYCFDIVYYFLKYERK